MNGQKRKILIVDDDAALRDMLSCFFKRYEFELRTAETGKEVFSVFDAFGPELVLLDVQLPDSSGYEICKTLKSRAPEKTPPILMLTSMDEEKNKLEGFEAGADDYITKPVRLSELLARVRAHLRIRDLTVKLVALEKAATVGQMAIALEHEINNLLTAAALNVDVLSDWLKENGGEGRPLETAGKIRSQIFKIRDMVHAQTDAIDVKTREYMDGERMIDFHAGAPAKENR